MRTARACGRNQFPVVTRSYSASSGSFAVSQGVRAGRSEGRGRDRRARDAVRTCPLGRLEMHKLTGEETERWAFGAAGGSQAATEKWNSRGGLPRNRSAGGKGSIIDEGHVSVRGPGARDDVRSMAALAGRSSEALLFFLLFVSRGLIQHLSRDLCL